jgi:hypothetical protein
MSQKQYFPVTPYTNTNGQPHYKCPVCKELVHVHYAWLDSDGKQKHHHCLKTQLKLKLMDKNESN